jgi:hypothetical protein
MTEEIVKPVQKAEHVPEAAHRNRGMRKKGNSTTLSQLTILICIR